MGKVFWWEWSVLIIVVLLMLVIPFGAHASDGPIGMYEVRGNGVHKNWFSLDDPNAPKIIFMNPELEIWAEAGVLHISDPKREIKKIVFEW